MSARSAEIERNTKETQVSVSVNLDGQGTHDLSDGHPLS